MRCGSEEARMPAAYEVYALSPGGRTVDWSTRLYLHPAGDTMT